MHERRPTTEQHYDERLQEWVDSRIYPTEDGGLAIFQRYVTESKRREEQLRRTAAYLADAEALSHTGTWAWNAITGELFWSAEHSRIFGLEADSVKPTYDIAISAVHPDDRRPRQHPADEVGQEQSDPAPLQVVDKNQVSGRLSQPPQEIDRRALAAAVQDANDAAIAFYATLEAVAPRPAECPRAR